VRSPSGPPGRTPRSRTPPLTPPPPTLIVQWVVEAVQVACTPTARGARGRSRRRVRTTRSTPRTCRCWAPGESLCFCLQCVHWLTTWLSSCSHDLICFSTTYLLTPRTTPISTTTSITARRPPVRTTQTRRRPTGRSTTTAPPPPPPRRPRPPR